MNGALASHYAHALAEAVLSPDSDLASKEAIDQLRSVEFVMSSSKELDLVFRSPAVAKEQKAALARQLAEELHLHETIRNFLLLVVAHRRANELNRMVGQFEEALDERLGLIPAEIYSRRDLTSEEQGTLEQALSRSVGKPVRVRYKVDLSLLGGIRAFVASKEYDTTIRGRLERLRTKLFADC